MKFKTDPLKRIIVKHLPFCMLFVCAGCDLFLDVPPPTTELATASVFTSNSTANAAITSVYAQMATGTGVHISWLSGLSADEFVNYGTNQDIIAFYTNSLTPVNPNITNYFWTPYYNMIFRANAILEGLEENSGVSEDVKKQLNGEAKFIRAFYHFYLTSFFGDIPLVTSSDYRTNAILPRFPQSTVYEQIVADLTNATSLLATHYVGGDGISLSNERVRPNQAAAEALLARVYLYIGEYEKAEQKASVVIDNPLYELSDDLTTVFLANSAEAVWQLQPFPNAMTTYADWYILSGLPGSGLARSVTISDNILDNYEATDLRFSDWVGSVTVDDNTYFFPNKHRMTVNNNTEYNMVMRLAEQYLIRAEARIQQGKIEAGLADLNALRTRADVQEFDVETIDVNPLLLVEQERQRELFAEGHRWFDLHRTDRIDEVMGDIALTKGGQWSTHAKLYPIPEVERTNNPNLSQNSGY